MARKKHTAEEIVAKRRQVDVLMAQGRPRRALSERRFHSAADPPCDRIAVRALGREAPPSARRVQVSYGTEEIVTFAQRLQGIPSEKR